MQKLEELIDEKKYLARIIANDNEGLQIISACCTGAKVKITDIKYLKSNKIFLLLIERMNVESENNQKKSIVFVNLIL